MKNKEKRILRINTMIGEIYEELSNYGIEPYAPSWEQNSSQTKPSEDWKRMRKKFDIIFNHI